MLEHISHNEAAAMLASTPGAINLRRHNTSTESSQKTAFFFPVELIDALCNIGGHQK